MNYEHGSGAGDDRGGEEGGVAAAAAAEGVSISSEEFMPNMEVSELKKKVMELDRKVKAAEDWKERAKMLDSEKMTNVKGCDSKNIRRPFECDGKKEDFIVWHVLFGA